MSPNPNPTLYFLEDAYGTEGEGKRKRQKKQRRKKQRQKQGACLSISSQNLNQRNPWHLPRLWVFSSTFEVFWKRTKKGCIYHKLT